MSVSILHTADLHIGLRFRHIQNDKARDRLVQERMDALKNMVLMANERRTDFFVIAGDLFDKQEIKNELVLAVINTLKKFNGQVLIVPGNHDYYEGQQSKLWGYFTKNSINTNIHLLTRKECETLISRDGQVVNFYPCPCPSKHSEQNEIGWVRDMSKVPENLHIGIAHGNVEGLALDTEGRYFNMSPAELKAAGIDCWLLGHVHVPFPLATYSGNPGFFMAGTHTPERSNRISTGQCWYIEFSMDRQIQFEQLVPGTITFLTENRKLASEAELELLEADLLAKDAANTILTLVLTGYLSQTERDKFNAIISSARARFLDISLEGDIRQKIDAALVRTEFPDNTFSQQLLLQLLNGPDHELKVQLAYDLIKECKA